MATPVEIQEHVKAESSSLDSWFNRVFGWSIFIFISISLLLCFFYLWEFPKFDTGQSIAADRWGQFGDFFGGVVGTIITFASIVFVYKAFKEQRLANVEAHDTNAEMLRHSTELKEQDSQHLHSERIQQFDGNFNTLLHLYQDSLRAYKSGSLEPGKLSMSNMVSSFIASTIFGNGDGYTKKTQAATTKFNSFITNHRTAVNTHMRLLYQLLILLQDSLLDDDDKIVYVKILRAQLCDEELLLIRYNCMTNRGLKMQMPVFHYNILKHLPLMDLLEFKKYRNGLSNTHINLLNDEIIYWRKNICSLFLIQSSNVKTKLIRQYGNRYSLNISVDSNNTHYSFTLLKKLRTGGRTYDSMITVLDKFSETDLESLLVGFHTEIFKFSHFRFYNRQSQFKIIHSNEHSNSTDCKITIKVTNCQPIVVSYSQVENPTPIN